MALAQAMVERGAIGIGRMFDISQGHLCLRPGLALGWFWIGHPHRHTPQEAGHARAGIVGDGGMSLLKVITYVFPVTHTGVFGRDLDV